jgi:hypothetical protein
VFRRSRDANTDQRREDGLARRTNLLSGLFVLALLEVSAVSAVSFTDRVEMQ